MKVGIVIVGIDGWQEHTEPLLESLRKHEQYVYTVLIDNGSEPAYPETELCEVHRLNNTVSYAAALNIGMRYVAAAEWKIVTNNDVIVHKPFTSEVLGLSPKYLYGFDEHQVIGRDYLQGWAYFISREIWEDVGSFDENYSRVWFDDADYCFRVKQKGYGLFRLDAHGWGILHADREREREESRNKHRDIYDANKEYLRQKWAQELA